MHLWGQPPNFSSRRDVRWGVALVTSREMAAPETLRVAANVLRLKGRTLLVPALATTVLLVMLVVDVRSPATVRDRTFAHETVTRAPGNRLVDRDLFASNAAARPLLGLKLSGSTIGPGQSGPPAASSSGAAESPAPGPAAEPSSATAQYQLPGCACRRSYDPAAVRRLNGTRSSCGGFADLRGPGQNVISFSFYGNASSVFFGGIEANLREVPSVYPGWVVRVYHDIDLSQPGQSQLVCRVACRYDNVDFCDVRNLPGLGDLSKKFGMIWRFMPLADDTVERFIVRDLDSLIGSRERAAVDEWIASNKTFHAMRDAPAHGTEILGGMWGGWNRHNDIYRRVRQRIINSTQWKFKGLDQRVLTVVLWPHIVKHRDLIAHDSYLCWYYPMSKPFPTQRKSPHDFVGSPSLIDKGFRLKTHCSYFCRPRDHKDWVWC
ncbi:uncharacterized protein LOC119090994 [Pollicipes pollicipes]|uniref:uncharacterized protein LOC119090994 n=1 Tax=Pollicipes pollicipes TaxID=41117 RepID=UPI001884F0DB|nr:uncharacterized protein LOC119090994 [Pollicipes pollicipes]